MGLDIEQVEGPLLEWRGAGEHREGGRGTSGEGDLVEGEGCEIVEEGAEAVDGVAVGSSPGVRPCLGALGDPSGLDGRVPGGAGRRAVVVLEQERREAPAHVPLDVVGEHAEEDVGADVVGGIDIDGTHPEEVLDGAEGLLDTGEALVGFDGRLAADGLGGEAGADDIDAVELGLGRDAVVAPGPGECVVGGGDVEVLFDLLAVGVAADATVDVVPSTQPGVTDRGGDVLEDVFGGAEKVFALSGALLAQAGVETDEETLAGEVGGW